MQRYTRENIEDWDFRAWRSPLLEGGSAFSDPETLFLSEHLLEVVVVDHERLIILETILNSGLGRVSSDRTSVLLTPEGEAALPYMTAWRDLLTHDGRLHRRIIKSLAREWRKNRQLRGRLLPANMEESFPGLVESG